MNKKIYKKCTIEIFVIGYSDVLTASPITTPDDIFDSAFGGNS